MARYEGILTVPGRLALDRSFVSEWVYGTVLRGMSRLSMNDLLSLTGAVAERRGAFAYLSTTLACLEARLTARPGTPAWDARVISRLCQEYDHVFDEIGRRAEVQRMDTTHGL